MKALAVAAAVWAIVVLGVAPSCADAKAATPRHRFTADEVRWYIQGFVDAHTGLAWGAVDGRCVEGRTSHVFVCLVVSRTSAGAVRCYRAVVSLDGRFVVPITRGRCSPHVAKGLSS